MKILSTFFLLFISLSFFAQNDKVIFIESAFFSVPNMEDVLCSDYCVASILKTDESGDYIGIYLTDGFMSETNSSNKDTNSFNDLFLSTGVDGAYDLNPKYIDVVFKLEIEELEVKDEIGSFTMLLLKSVSLANE